MNLKAWCEPEPHAKKRKEIYLDNSATTRPYDEVVDYMERISRETYGNPSSLHLKGIEAERLVKKARETIAASLGANPKEIIFTSGGTESNNLAILGYLDANPKNGRHIIATKIEHPSVLEVFKRLESRGYQAEYIDVDEKGMLDLEKFRSAIKEDTSLISVILVNNETGSIQAINKIVEIKNSINPKTAFHVDAVQAYGKMNLTTIRGYVDFMSVSSHKIHGPKGAGALYVKNKTKINPIIFGGGQEKSLRSGTENVAGICGFGLAAKMAFDKIEENHAKAEKLKSLFINKLKTCSYELKIISPEHSSPYILNVSFKHVPAEVLLHHLESRNIFVSTGAACSSRKNLQSHVLAAMKIEKCYAEGAVRFSFSVFNTEEDIIEVSDALGAIVPKLQAIYGGKPQV